MSQPDNSYKLTVVVLEIAVLGLGWGAGQDSLPSLDAKR